MLCHRHPRASAPHRSRSLRGGPQVEALVDYVVSDPPPDADDARKFKYPFVACEVFTCEIDAVFATLLDDSALVAKLFGYLDRPAPLNPLQAGYFSKVIGVLLSRRTADTMKYLEDNQAELLPKLVRHIGTTSVLVEVMLRLVGADEQLATFHPESVAWVAETNLVELVLEQMKPDKPLEVHQNAGLMLQAIARATTGELSLQLAKPTLIRALVDAGLAEPHAPPAASATTAAATIAAADDEDDEVVIQPKSKRTEEKKAAEGEGSSEGAGEGEGGADRAKAEANKENEVVYPTRKQLLAHAAQVIIAILEPRPPPAAMDINAQMALAGMPGVESVMADVESELATPEVIAECLEGLPRLVPRLDGEPDAEELLTTFMPLKTPLGTHRLRVVELIANVVQCGGEAAVAAVVECGALARCLELFTEFPFNNFLHHPVEAIVSTTLEHGAEEVVSRVLVGSGDGERPADIVGMLTRATSEPMIGGEASGGKTFRAGNLGHVTMLGNKLTELKEQRECVAAALDADERWAAWAADVLATRNELENVTKWECGRPAMMEEPSMDSDGDDFRSSGFEVSSMQSNLSCEMYQRYGVFEGDDDDEDEDEDGQSEGGDALAHRAAGQDSDTMFEDNPLLAGPRASGHGAAGGEDDDDSSDSSDGGDSSDEEEGDSVVITPASLGLTTDVDAQNAGFEQLEDGEDADAAGGSTAVGVQGGAEADMAAVRQELLNLSVDEAPGAETDDVNEGGKDFTTNNYWKTPYAPGLTPEELELLG